jgi:hypothetical protein
MTHFLHKNTALRQECIQSIEDSLKTMENQQCCLIDPALDPEEDDIYWDLPLVVHFGKYEYGVEYAITNVRLENDSVWFNGHTPTEGDEYSFAPSELEMWALTQIADTLIELKDK